MIRRVVTGKTEAERGNRHTRRTAAALSSFSARARHGELADLGLPGSCARCVSRYRRAASHPRIGNA